jgi:signal transduction histidine kinase/ligand-binding sensor domain-containing protein
LLFCQFGFVAWALDPGKRISQYRHTAWRREDGYFSGVPFTIGQTSDGYIWIGTRAGLIRFDGVQFTDWTPPAAQHLASPQRALLGSRDGSLWIGTEDGLARWKDHRLTHYVEGQCGISDIFEDHNGTIWVSRFAIKDNRGAVCRAQGEELVCYGKPEGVPFYFSAAVREDKSGSLMLGGDGICRWKPGSQCSYVQKPELNKFKANAIYTMTISAEGALWVSQPPSNTRRGLEQWIDGKWRFPEVAGLDPQHTEIESILSDRDNSVWFATLGKGIFRLHNGEADHFGSAEGLSSDTVGGLFEDSEGNIWAATTQGIDKFSELRVTSFSKRQGLVQDNTTTAVLASRDGSVWATASGALQRLIGGKVSAIRSGQGLPGFVPESLFEDDSGRLWFGLDGGLYVRERNRFHTVAALDGLPIGIVSAMSEDNQHNLWVVAERQRRRRLIEIQGMKVRREIASPEMPPIFSIARNPDGGLWLGLVDGGLASYKDRVLQTVVTRGQVSNSTIYGLLVEPANSVLGTTSKGLLWWNNGQIRKLTSLDGLACDTLYSAIRDGAGTVWINAECGIMALDRRELDAWWKDPANRVKPRILAAVDGARPIPPQYAPTVSRSTDGRLWFANGVLQMVDPSRLSGNTRPPPVHVEQLVADRKQYAAVDDLLLPPHTRDLRIGYTALSFALPRYVRFRYKLDGYDREWQDPEFRREAFYSELPPSRYTFRVIAANEAGVWNTKGAIWTFRIAPAYYQTTWFRLLSVGTFAIALFGLYKFRLRQISNQLKLRFDDRLAERTRIGRDLHDTMLQSITGLTLQIGVVARTVAEPQSAKSKLTDLRRAAEECLREARQSIWDIRSLDAEDIDLASALCASGEQLAAAARTRFLCHVEGEATTIESEVSVQLLRIAREAIGNAAQHARASEIQARLGYQPNRFLLEIRDDGVGFDVNEAAHLAGHFGLTTMRERAAKIGAALTVSSQLGHGTSIKVDLPVGKR